MRKLAAIGVLCALAVTGVACGETDETGGGSEPAATQDAQERREAREARRVAREARQARRARAARREARRQARIRAERRADRRAAAEAQAAPEPEPVSECDPNYAGACLDPSAPDYDCEGGSGDGPLYTGRVEVVGSDVHGLDNDGDGVACE